MDNSAKPVRTLLSWSSGKDSAWTLYKLQQDPTVELVGLLTTFNQRADRVAMHAVRRELVKAQAVAAGLPLIEVELPWPCTNDDYERLSGAAFASAKAKLGVAQVAFGDLFLDDIRAYRERQMEAADLRPLFPLWGQATDMLAREMTGGGLRAYLTCVDPSQLAREFAGRSFDNDLLADLPDGIDPCGENGEFHSFVYAGPMFTRTIAVITGEIREQDGFVFADVLPA